MSEFLRNRKLKSTLSVNGYIRNECDGYIPSDIIGVIFNYYHQIPFKIIDKSSLKPLSSPYKFSFIIAGTNNVGKHELYNKLSNFGNNIKQGCSIIVELMDDDDDNSQKVRLKAGSVYDYTHNKKYAENNELISKTYINAIIKNMDVYKPIKYYADHGIIMVFDITNKYSFEYIKNKYYDIKKNCKYDMGFILVGNKIDLKSQKIIHLNDIKGFIGLNNIKYISISALNNINIKQMLFKITEELMINIKHRYTISLNDDSNGNSNDNNNSITCNDTCIAL